MSYSKLFNLYIIKCKRYINQFNRYLPKVLKDRLSRKSDELFIENFSKHSVDWSDISRALALIDSKDYSNYTVGKGRTLLITSAFHSAAEYLYSLDIYIRAIPEQNFSAARRIVFDIKTHSLAEWLLNAKADVYNINLFKEHLSQKINKLQQLLSVADNQLGEYYQRNLNNILHETRVVTETLLNARNLNEQSKIKSKADKGHTRSAE